MSAVKQFDRKEVLDRAMRVFWERGYEATSIQNLVEATGINRASLYATFGGKKELFINSLSRYEEVFVKPLCAALDAPTPRRATSGCAGIAAASATPPGRADAFTPTPPWSAPWAVTRSGNAVAEFF